MFLLQMPVGAATQKIPGLGPVLSQEILQNSPPRAEKPFEEEATKLSTSTWHQAVQTVKLFEIAKDESLFTLAKGSKPKKKGEIDQQAREAQRKLEILLVPGTNGDGAYAGGGYDKEKGKITIGKNGVEVAAKGILADHKSEVAVLKKDHLLDNIPALEATVKSSQSLGMYYTAIFSAKKVPQDRVKASKHLDSAVKALKTMQPKKKNEKLTRDQRAYLITNLAIIRALEKSSGAVLTQQALIAELERLADPDRTNIVQQRADKLIETAKQELATPEPGADKMTAEQAAKLGGAGANAAAGYRPELASKA